MRLLKPLLKILLGNFLGITSGGAILMDQRTGTVLYEHNSHEQLRPASVTKVMTILLIMEAIDNGVITLEDKGSMFLDDEYVKIMPTYNVKVKDTTGAGDIFHGAFTYGIANGYSLEESVKLGNIAGALSTRKIGARNSVPTLEEVMELYEK